MMLPILPYTVKIVFDEQQDKLPVSVVILKGSSFLAKSQSSDRSWSLKWGDDVDGSRHTFSIGVNNRGSSSKQPTDSYYSSYTYRMTIDGGKTYQFSGTYPTVELAVSNAIYEYNDYAKLKNADNEQTKAFDTNNYDQLEKQIRDYLLKADYKVNDVNIVIDDVYSHVNGKSNKPGFISDLYSTLDFRIEGDTSKDIDYVVGLTDKYMQKAGTKAFDNPFSDPPVFFYRKDEDFYSVYYKNNQWVVTHESRDHNDKKAVLTTKNIPDVVNYFSQQRLSTSGIESELTGYLKRHSSEKSLDWFKGKR